MQNRGKLDFLKPVYAQSCAYVWHPAEKACGRFLELNVVHFLDIQAHALVFQDAHSPIKIYVVVEQSKRAVFRAAAEKRHAVEKIVAVVCDENLLAILFRAAIVRIRVGIGYAGAGA